MNEGVASLRGTSGEHPETTAPVHRIQVTDDELDILIHGLRGVEIVENWFPNQNAEMHRGLLARCAALREALQGMRE